MALLVSENYEAGPSGAAMTTGNTSFKNLVTAGWTFSNAQVLPSVGGSLSGRCQASATSEIANGVSAFAAKSKLFMREYIYVTARPAAYTPIAQIRSATTLRAQLMMGPTGDLRMRNSGTVAIHTSPADAVPLNQWVRVEWSYDNTAATQRVRVFKGANLHGAMPDYDSGAVTTTAAGTADGFDIGWITSTTATAYHEAFAIDDAAFPAPLVVPNAPPTANAGPDQNVQPRATVTLTGTSSDSDGTIASRQWAQTSGPTVALSGASTATATFEAPALAAGATLVFSFTVTDDDGATGSDSVTVNVAATTSGVVDKFSAMSTAAGKSLVIPVPRAVSAGSTIALAAVRDDVAGNVGGVESIVDSRGNTWALHDAFSLRYGQAETTWHHCHVETALQPGDTITVTWAANRARKMAAAHVLSGMQLVPVDATSGRTITSNPTNSGAYGNSSTPSASTQAATTQAKGILLAAIGTGSTAGAFTSGAGFTLGEVVATDAGTSDRQLFTEYRTLTTTGVKTADGTFAGTSMWAEAVVAFASVASSAPPTANAGPDQTVEPWSTVTVGGTDTTAPGTSVTQIAWTQLSGPPVALSGADATQASFSAPPGAAQAAVVLRKSVTDGNGGTASDDAAITILRATEFGMFGGVLVPQQIRG